MGDFIMANWSAIATAPAAFIALALLGGAAGFALARHLAEGAKEALRERLAAAHDEIARLKEATQRSRDEANASEAKAERKKADDAAFARAAMVAFVRSPFDPLHDNLPNELEQVLRVLVMNTRTKDEMDIARVMNVQEQLALHMLEELRKRRLVSNDVIDGWSVTPSGRSYMAHRRLL